MRPRKVRHRETRLANPDPAGNRAQRRAAARSQSPTAESPRRDLPNGEAMTEPNPTAGPELKPDPSGRFYTLPALDDGEAPLPFVASVGVGLTAPDSKGRRYTILELTDGTLTVKLRIPPDAGPGLGIAIANGLTAMAERELAERHSGLIVPGGNSGSLLVPPGAAVR